ncbi:MAG: hypothetical protein GYA51_08180, partial [Candidatus Methanofastidiosa archaeon]|nr:hypothetical protein [Candidatus Methanofastidiosa archaeon]
MKSCIYASGFNKKDSILRINNGDRSLKARKNILAMFIIKGLSISITFAYVPLLIKILTTEIYGVWITLVSFIGWLSYFDVGLGHGLRNKFGEAIALHEVNNARSYVSTAYIIMTFVAVILLIAQFCLFPLIDWAEVLNAPQNMTKELNSLVLFIGTLTSLQLVIKLITSILLALQKPASSALIVALGQIITFILVFTLVKLNITTTIVDLGVVITLVPIVVLT